jgi:putative transposase
LPVRLDDAYPYLILDARYEKIREHGVIRSQAVLVAIGIDWEGRRCVLAVELASRESISSWKEFVLALKQRGLNGVDLVVSDDHPGFARLYAKRCQKQLGNAAMSISCAMRSISYRERPTTSA